MSVPQDAVDLLLDFAVILLLTHGFPVELGRVEHLKEGFHEIVGKATRRIIVPGGTTQTSWLRAYNLLLLLSVGSL
jgi:hypothetical protein